MSKNQIKVFISIVILLILSLGIYFMASEKKNNDVKPESYPINLMSSPTPFLLPTKTFSKGPSFQTIFGQLFGTQNKVQEYEKILTLSKENASSNHFDLYVNNNYLPVDATTWLKASEDVHEYESARLHLTLDNKTILIFLPKGKGNCAARGMTLNGTQQVILIYADQDSSLKQMIATLAHELGHVFINKYYVNLSALALNEGLATWIAGDFWTNWKGYSFDDGVRLSLRENSYLPLFQNFDMNKAYSDSADCLTSRDKLLTEFASFIEYLIQTYGMSNLILLINTPQSATINSQRVIYPPDFYNVYGLQLNQLEYNWLIDLTNK
jgi:hypothetical protein